MQIGVKDFSALEPLSEREVEVLSLVSEGMTNAEIAEKLALKKCTITTYLNNINGKLYSSKYRHKAIRAIRLGLSSFQPVNT